MRPQSAWCSLCPRNEVIIPASQGTRPAGNPVSRPQEPTNLIGVDNASALGHWLNTHMHSHTHTHTEGRRVRAISGYS
eukprot:13695707-Alexandrium_andersonii.AAC.1